MGTMSDTISAPCILYYLADPRCPRRPRYVGVTRNPVSRLKRHRAPSLYNDALRAWKLALRADGVHLEMYRLAELPSLQAARAAEWRLIRRWRRRGLCDCNAPRDGAWDATKLEWAGRRNTNLQESLG